MKEPNGSETHERTIKQTPRTGRFSKEQITRAVASAKDKRRVREIAKCKQCELGQLYEITNGEFEVGRGKASGSLNVLLFEETGDFGYYELFGSFPINFCPMCGRKLKE